MFGNLNIKVHKLQECAVCLQPVGSICVLPHIPQQFRKEPSVMIFEGIMFVVTVNIFGVLTHAVKCLSFAVCGL